MSGIHAISLPSPTDNADRQGGFYSLADPGINGAFHLDILSTMTRSVLPARTSQCRKRAVSPSILIRKSVMGSPPPSGTRMSPAA